MWSNAGNDRIHFAKVVFNMVLEDKKFEVNRLWESHKITIKLQVQKSAHVIVLSSFDSGICSWIQLAKPKQTLTNQNINMNINKMGQKPMKKLFLNGSIENQRILPSFCQILNFIIGISKFLHILSPLSKTFLKNPKEIISIKIYSKYKMVGRHTTTWIECCHACGSLINFYLPIQSSR